MSKQRVAILLLAVLAVSALAFGARADAIVLDDRVAVVVLPAPEGFSDGGDIPEGMIAVFVEPARDVNSNGGDIPEGFVAVIAQSINGFSDGGDIVLARPAPDGFSDENILHGMIVVFAEPAGEAHTGGVNIPEGMVAVLMEPLPGVPLLSNRG